VVAKPAVAPAAPATTVAATPPAPVKAVDGVLTVDAAAFTKQQGEGMFGGYPGVIVMDSPSGGKQIYFAQQMKFCWAEYVLDVPASGTYEVTMKAACVNEDQVLDVCSGTNVLATAAIPLNYGLWETTKPVDVKLEKGIQSVRIALPVNNPKRGIALKSFQLKPKGATSVVAKQ